MSHRLGATLVDLARAEGKAEGRAEEARALVLRIGRRRLGEPEADTQTAPNYRHWSSRLIIRELQLDQAALDLSDEEIRSLLVQALEGSGQPARVSA